MRIYALGSGSSGNCLVVEAEGERLLVDAGLGPNRAIERMRALGADLVTHRSPLGLFVTHEHGDHAAHALQIARALRAPLYLHAGVGIDRARRKAEVRAYAPGRPVAVGPFIVDAMPIPHDAANVALRISAGGRRLAFAADLGHAPKGLQAMLASVDLAMLEANYCPMMLETGPYPLHLKRRVAGSLGHLANEDAATLAAGLDGTRLGKLVLIHISRTNNTPARALEVVSAKVKRLPVEVLPNGVPRVFDVPATTGWRAAEQLALGF
jgi:phosphoribosyl 1,2-cyclic phosphodiesterase